MVIDKKGTVQPSVVREELERLVKRELSTSLRCYPWPESSDVVPDNHDLKLAVMAPGETYKLEQLESWLSRRGSGFRVYKNTLFFALPDQERYARFVESIKEHLALQEIQEEIRRDERPGMIEKRGEIKRRIQKFEDDAPLKVREMYRTAAVPRNGGSLERIDLGQPAIGNERLDTWYRKELSDQTRGKILVRPPSDRLIQVKFLSNGDAVSLHTVLEQFYKDPSLPALADATVLAEAIAGGIRSGSFGLTRGTPEEPDANSLLFEEVVSQHAISFTEDSILLTPERARKLREQVEPKSQPGPEPQPPGPQPRSPGPDSTPTAPGPGPAPVDEKVNRIAFRASGIPSSKLIDISRGVFTPLTREAGEFTFTIEIDVSSADGISKKVIEQQVMETLQQLGARVEKRDD